MAKALKNNIEFIIKKLTYNAHVFSEVFKSIHELYPDEVNDSDLEDYDEES